MQNKFKNFINTLFINECAIRLSLFRILFGMIHLYSFLYSYFYLGKLNKIFIAPQFPIPYPLTPFIQPTSKFGMILIFSILVITSFNIMIGYKYRLSIITFFILYSYQFLANFTQYNNHYYLVILITFLMIFMDADSTFSFENKKKKNLIPFWNYFILRSLMCIVFFYGGVAKLTSFDWIKGIVLRINFNLFKDHSILGPILDTNFFSLLISWSGAFFDLLIPFFIIFKRTRYASIILLIFFHLTNGYIFFSDIIQTGIGIFPILGISYLILFLPKSQPQKFLKSFVIKLKKYGQLEKNISLSMKYFSKIKLCLMIMFILFVFIYPIRRFLNPEIDARLYHHSYFGSWLDLTTFKKGGFTIYGKDITSGSTVKFNNLEGLNPIQQNILNNPFALMDYKKFFNDYLQLQNMNYNLFIDTDISLNNKPFIKYFEKI